MYPSGYALLTVLWVTATTALVLQALLYTAALEARTTLEETQHLLATPQASLALVQAGRALGGPLHNQLRQTLLGYSSSLNEAQRQAVVNQLQTLSDQLVCGYRFRIHFTATACGQPLPQGVSLPAAEELPLGFRRLPFAVVATPQPQVPQRYTLQQGEFRVRIGTQPVTRYALISQGDPPPFGSQMLVGGPVWVNGYPRFSGQPLFTDGFRSTGCRQLQPSCLVWQQPQAQLGTEWMAPINLSPGSAVPCYPSACPSFAGGIDWGAQPPTWPQDNPPLAIASLTSGPRGLLIEGNVSSIYLTVVDGSTQMVLCQSRCNNYLLRRTPEGIRLEGPSQVITPFAGVIYINGSIGRLSGTQPAYTAIPLTLAARGDITLGSSLTATQPPCSQPASRQDAVYRAAYCPHEQPLLGLYSHTGQIWLEASSATTLHAALFIRSGRLAWKPGAGPLWLVGSLASAGADQWPQSLTYPPYLGGTPPPGFPSLGLVRESLLIYSP